MKETDRLKLKLQEYNENIDRWGEYLNSNHKALDEEFRKLADELVGDELGEYTGLKGSYNSVKERLDEIERPIHVFAEHLRNVSDSINGKGGDFGSNVIFSSEAIYERTTIQLSPGSYDVLSIRFGSSPNDYIYLEDAKKKYYFKRPIYDENGNQFAGQIANSQVIPGFAFIRSSGISIGYRSSIVIVTDTNTVEDSSLGATFGDFAKVTVISVTSSSSSYSVYLYFYDLRTTKKGTGGIFYKNDNQFLYSNIGELGYDPANPPKFQEILGKFAPKEGDIFHIKYNIGSETYEFESKIIEVDTSYIKIEDVFPVDSSVTSNIEWRIYDPNQLNLIVGDLAYKNSLTDTEITDAYIAFKEDLKNRSLRVIGSSTLIPFINMFQYNWATLLLINFNNVRINTFIDSTSKTIQALNNNSFYTSKILWNTLARGNIFTHIDPTAVYFISAAEYPYKTETILDPSTITTVTVKDINDDPVDVIQTIGTKDIKIYDPPASITFSQKYITVTSSVSATTDQQKQTIALLIR